MKVVWSEAAKQAYLDIIDQILLSWNIKVVEKLELEVNQLVKNISKYKNFCPKSKQHNLHRCIINRHNSLIYRLKNDNVIEIVTMTYNKSGHQF